MADPSSHPRTSASQPSPSRSPERVIGEVIAVAGSKDLREVGAILEDIGNRYLDLAELCSAIHAEHEQAGSGQAGDLPP